MKKSIKKRFLDNFYKDLDETLDSINDETFKAFDEAMKVLDSNKVPERERIIHYTDNSKQGYEKWIGGEISHNEITNGVRFINIDKINDGYNKDYFPECRKVKVDVVRIVNMEDWRK